MKYLPILAALSCVLGTACGADSGDPNLPQAPNTPFDDHAPRPGDATEEAKYVIELPGEEVRFLVDDYGSVGVLGASRTGASVLDHRARRRRRVRKAYKGSV